MCLKHTSYIVGSYLFGLDFVSHSFLREIFVSSSSRKEERIDMNNRYAPQVQTQLVSGMFLLNFHNLGQSLWASFPNWCFRFSSVNKKSQCPLQHHHAVAFVPKVQRNFLPSFKVIVGTNQRAFYGIKLCIANARLLDSLYTRIRYAMYWSCLITFVLFASS